MPGQIVIGTENAPSAFGDQHFQCQVAGVRLADGADALQEILVEEGAVRPGARSGVGRGDAVDRHAGLTQPGGEFDDGVELAALLLFTERKSLAVEHGPARADPDEQLSAWPRGFIFGNGSQLVDAQLETLEIAGGAHCAGDGVNAGLDLI